MDDAAELTRKARNRVRKYGGHEDVEKLNEALEKAYREIKAGRRAAESFLESWFV